MSALLVASMLACGGRANDDRSGKSGGTGGSSGDSTSGGSGEDQGAQCTPGVPLPALDLGALLGHCGAVVGLPNDANLVLDIRLDKPIGPGQTLAFSAGLKLPNGGDFEMYGAGSECGAVVEKLSAVHLAGDGVACHELNPSLATYSHLIWVWHSTETDLIDVNLCESGTCPTS